MISFVIHFTIFAYKKKKKKKKKLNQPKPEFYKPRTSDLYLLCKAKVNIPKKKKIKNTVSSKQRTNINMVCFNSLSIDIKVTSFINNYVTLP